MGTGAVDADDIDGRERKRKTLVSCKFSSDTSKVKDSGLQAETPQESQMPLVFSE